jgi:short-subunit dehydrogenase
MIRMGSKSNSQIKQENTKDAFYSSLEEWEAETFPKLTKKRERKLLEQKPDSLGVAIADEIFREICVELSKSS